HAREPCGKVNHTLTWHHVASTTCCRDTQSLAPQWAKADQHSIGWLACAILTPDRKMPTHVLVCFAVGFDLTHHCEDAVNYLKEIPLKGPYLQSALMLRPVQETLHYSNLRLKHQENAPLT
ncbi:hypothetical protein D018_3954B, partial [Vibrio parahaemolyticus VP2007-007]